jgi:hypothetical protein
MIKISYNGYRMVMSATFPGVSANATGLLYSGERGNYKYSAI